MSAGSRFVGGGPLDGQVRALQGEPPVWRVAEAPRFADYSAAPISEPPVLTYHHYEKRVGGAYYEYVGTHGRTV